MRQKETGKLLGETLVGLGFATEEDVAGVVAIQYRIPYIPLKQHEFDREMIKLVPKETAVKYGCFPVDKIGRILTIAMENPLDERAVEEIEAITKYKVLAYVSTPGEITEAIEAQYEKVKKDAPPAKMRPVPKAGGPIKVFQLETNGISEE
ncbi:MAG: hypothetical protein NT045_00835 [Candidatus Aureabacteria bacterium]|nr:hypothetical protein [Candidatus Auribacterota bacterium]